VVPSFSDSKLVACMHGENDHHRFQKTIIRHHAHLDTSYSCTYARYKVKELIRIRRPSRTVAWLETNIRIANLHLLQNNQMLSALKEAA